MLNDTRNGARGYEVVVTSSEGEFQGYVIEWANQIIRDDGLPFDHMTQLPNVRIGRGRREPDTVLWLDRSAEKALCEFELKTPEYSPWSAELITAASTKADQIHERQTCASREPWYDLGTRDPAPLFYPIAHKRRPVIGVNAESVHSGDNLLEIVPGRDSSVSLLASSLFSSFGQLQAEIEGRVNFGEGVLKTQAIDVTRFAVLDTASLGAAIRGRITDAFEALESRPIALIWEEMEREDRQRLDDVMLESLGFRDADERFRIRREIYEAMCALTTERMEKPKSVKPKRSSNASVDIAAMAESLIADEIEPSEVRAFPQDFIPSECATDSRSFPPGPAYVETGHLYQTPLVRIGEAEFPCRSAIEARYLGYAINAGQSEVSVPKDESALADAVREYEVYVRAMEKRLDVAIAERVTNKSLGRAVKKEALKLLRLVPVYV